MLLHIEKGSSTPISRQIRDQIREQCLSGVLKPGEKLPSVRELARELAVNVNTVFRVYERLASERLVELRHGDGTYVLPPTDGDEAGLTEQRSRFESEFDQLVHRGLLLGIPPADLKARLNRVLRSAGKAAK
ncbi:HTH-type transcriptional repressor YtrA [Maioricimonas rarisocia]|uniref:HTH-type transcriptional repressor YtrA n=1 Tax=Maioricimonas rarisocia TaxID=2528026 RepID=A0A517Z1I7_9PLAN|nr:GntR family transcriptional regulator [Maioricimonas rarisocia]QDU36342.1 HTH-type transcriptional repressor YtrA [Maioricimonas rarisocia]